MIESALPVLKYWGPIVALIAALILAWRNNNAWRRSYISLADDYIDLKTKYEQLNRNYHIELRKLDEMVAELKENADEVLGNLGDESNSR